MKSREWPPSPKKKKGETPYDVLDTWTFSSQKEHKLAMKKIVESSDLNTGKGHDRASEAIAAYKSVKKETVTTPEGKTRRVKKKLPKTPDVISELPRPELELTEEVPPYPDEAAQGHMEELSYLEKATEDGQEQREIDEAQAKGIMGELSALEASEHSSLGTQDTLTPEEEKAQAVGQAIEMRDFEVADRRRFIADRKREHEQQWAEQIASELSRMEEDAVPTTEVTPLPLAQTETTTPQTPGMNESVIVVSDIESSPRTNDGASIESRSPTQETSYLSTSPQKTSGEKDHGKSHKASDHHGKHKHGKPLGELIARGAIGGVGALIILFFVKALDLGRAVWGSVLGALGFKGKKKEKASVAKPAAAHDHH